MSDAPEDVPWHRVVGSDGDLRIARRSPEMGREQRVKLEADGGDGFGEWLRGYGEVWRWVRVPIVDWEGRVEAAMR